MLSFMCIRMTYFLLAYMMVIPLSLIAVSTSHTVSASVAAVNSLSISGDPSVFFISGVSLGGGGAAVSDTSTKYSVTTNQINQKIIGSLGEELPTGLSLSISLQAPEGATTRGIITLSSMPLELVVDISTTTGKDLEIAYSFSASQQAAAMSNLTRVVTFTLTSGA